ncbi:hypothetical protein JRX38_02635 [Gluconobacter cerinus]|uniref:hypothetical protein n=1 Tax=Gluconobacter cerinus TaxID=38307 RepID=UPI00193EDD09|nr:hypothetical protein [Gluconobacter cerinus]MBM3096928.1 hypothetical protein [Gluconobacter cerinus]
MPPSIEISDNQFETITAILRQISEHQHGWDWHNAIPTGIGACLGFFAAQVQDGIRRRRDKSKEKREKQEKELTQIGAIFTTLTFNFESAIHTAIQQVLPHHEATRKALELLGEEQKTTPISRIPISTVSEFIPEVFRRSPGIYLVSIDAFKDLSFLLEKYADVVKKFGWVESFSRDFVFIFLERNRMINELAISGSHPTNKDIYENIETQNEIARKEIGNIFQLIELYSQLLQDLITIQKELYNHLEKNKLSVIYPEIYQEVHEKLVASLEKEGMWEDMKDTYTK